MPAKKPDGQTADLERGAGSRTGFDGLVLANGERGTMQVAWHRQGARPILWRQGPGAWPDWCSLLDATSGTVACAPPSSTLPSEHHLNVTAVGLDPVRGLNQEIFVGVVSVVRTV